jgi:hypothetical protein
MAPLVRDQEVGGSNPLAPTIIFLSMLFGFRTRNAKAKPTAAVSNASHAARRRILPCAISSGSSKDPVASWSPFGACRSIAEARIIERKMIVNMGYTSYRCAAASSTGSMERSLWQGQVNFLGAIQGVDCLACALESFAWQRMQSPVPQSGAAR